MLKERRDWPKLIISILICQAAGGIGGLFTGTSLNSWYLQLDKPDLNPPGWVFGVVWPILYLMMGIALFLVWRKTPLGREEQTALLWFFVQLLLNIAWSWFFFGLRLPFFGLLEIAMLWVAIFITFIAFFRLSKTSALLLFPYLLWVSFAAYLNWSIVKLN